MPKPKPLNQLQKKIKDLKVLQDPECDLLAIDPGTTSIGWALYFNGKLENSGRVDLTRACKRPDLLDRLETLMDSLSGFDKPTVLAVENIGKGYTTHKSLLWAVGVIVVRLHPIWLLEVSPATWKKYRDKNYVKSDENDAILIGKAIYEELKLLDRR